MGMPLRVCRWKLSSGEPKQRPYSLTHFEDQSEDGYQQFAKVKQLSCNREPWIVAQLFDEHYGRLSGKSGFGRENNLHKESRIGRQSAGMWREELTFGINSTFQKWLTPNRHAVTTDSSNDSEDSPRSGPAAIQSVGSFSLWDHSGLWILDKSIRRCNFQFLSKRPQKCKLKLACQKQSNQSCNARLRVLFLSLFLSFNSTLSLSPSLWQCNVGRERFVWYRYRGSEPNLDTLFRRTFECSQNVHQKKTTEPLCALLPSMTWKYACRLAHCSTVTVPDCSTCQRMSEPFNSKIQL